MMDPRHPGIIGARVPLDLDVFPASSGIILGLCEVGAPSSLRLPSLPGSIVWHSLGPLLSRLRGWGRRLVCPRDDQSEAPDWLAPGLQSAPLLSASEVLHTNLPQCSSLGLSLCCFWSPAASMSVWIWGLLAAVRPCSFLLDGLLVLLSSFSVSGHLPQVHSSCALALRPTQHC